MSDRPPPLRRHYAIAGMAGVAAAIAVMAATLILAPRNHTACVLAMLASSWLLAISILLLLNDFHRTNTAQRRPGRGTSTEL